MDRRKRKTRSAIFSAFIGLLSEKSLEKITVAEVIERADVGRATFYAHFETRDHLLQELCRELFDHLFHREQGMESPGSLFTCEDTGSVFTDLLGHIYRNDNYLRVLFSGQNRGLFLEYFKQELYTLVHTYQSQFPIPPGVPEDLWIRQICALFVETVDWWIREGLTQPPERVAQYFLAAFDKQA
jgi:AcrR family transcriptional regulator